MTCKEFIALLDDLIDNTLAADLRAQIEEHLHRCSHCQVVYNTTRKTIEIYRSHEVYELPTNLRDRLHTAIMAKCKKGCK